jgi:hypothetical protein
MADSIHLQEGCPPWRPSFDAAVIDVYHRYDAPLEGLIEQHGATYLFRCIFGAAHSVSIWAYTLVDAEHRQALDLAEGDVFDKNLRELFAAPLVSVALADDEAGIVATAEMAGSLKVEQLVSNALHAIKQAVKRAGMASDRAELLLNA